eukprot:Gb_03355 [translate_table: standard]
MSLRRKLLSICETVGLPYLSGDIKDRSSNEISERPDFTLIRGFLGFEDFTIQLGRKTCLGSTGAFLKRLAQMESLLWNFDEDVGFVHLQRFHTFSPCSTVDQSLPIDGGDVSSIQSGDKNPTLETLG